MGEKERDGKLREREGDEEAVARVRGAETDEVKGKKEKGRRGEGEEEGKRGCIFMTFYVPELFSPSSEVSRNSIPPLHDLLSQVTDPSRMINSELILCPCHALARTLEGKPC